MSSEAALLCLYCNAFPSQGRLAPTVHSEGHSLSIMHATVPNCLYTPVVGWIKLETAPPVQKKARKANSSPIFHRISNFPTELHVRLVVWLELNNHQPQKCGGQNRGRDGD